MIQRRAFLTGLASALAAPAIVRAASLMPVRGIVNAVPRWTIEPGIFYGTSPLMEVVGNMKIIRDQIDRALYVDLFHAIHRPALRAGKLYAV